MTSSRTTRERYVPPERDGGEAERYFEGVLSGAVVACEKIKKLARIMLPRFSGGYKCWHYDPERALRPVGFIERFCFISQGRVGTHLVLEPFQLAFVECVFGFVDEAGIRQFNEAILMISRKNGKSELGAAIALFMLTKDGEFAPQLYSVATSKDQASLLYGAMLSMVRQSPALSKRLHKGIIPSRSQDGLIYKANMGYFTPLSSQTRSLDGLNVQLAVVDELHAITNRDLFDLMKQATAAREQPLILEITTNGFQRDMLFDEQYDYASQLLDGKFVDDRCIPFIYELDSREEWTDEACWVKSNPGLGSIKKEEYLRAQVNKAKNDQSYLPTVMTKDFNVPENKASAWLRYDEAVNRETFDMAEMGFRYGVFGYDASDSIDLTAAKCLMMRPDDDHIYELSMYWLPEAALEEHRRSGLRKSRDNVPYDIWERHGLIRIVPGNKVDHRVVFEWMAEVRDELDVYPFALGYDPWHLTDDSWQDMARQFVGRKRLEEVRQGAKTLSAPMKQIRADFAAGRIVDNDNPVNQWCRMNVSVTADRNDNILPCKANGASGRIDGFACELDAYIALMRHWDEYMANC